ncbi:MAG: hypothetical protein ABWX94_03250 [Candidatus Saccharimonadales bacterium]
MSIPSYNKFLVDRRENADQTDSSITYYAMFAVNELVLIGGGWLAYKKLLKRKVIVHEKAAS